MATPAWLGASTGQPGLAGQANQFIGSHTSTWVYSSGVLQSSQTTGIGAYQSTNGLYLAQQFTTGSSQTTVGRVALQVSAVGGSPVTATITALTVSLYASSFGVPTGPALAAAPVPEQYVYTSGFWVTVPLAATGLSPSTVYQLVVSAAGTSSAYYAWQESSQPSGASTSANGTSWSAQAFGLMFEVYDATGTTGSPTLMVDDGGARWISLTYTAAGQPATSTEYSVTQGGAGLYQTRTYTYSGTNLVGVS